MCLLSQYLVMILLIVALTKVYVIYQKRMDHLYGDKLVWVKKAVVFEVEFEVDPEKAEEEE